MGLTDNQKKMLQVGERFNAMHVLMNIQVSYIIPIWLNIKLDVSIA